MTLNFNIDLRRILALFITLMLIVSMCSCSASWHIRQAKNKAPELFRDTLETVSIDTVIVYTPKVDTVLKQLRDTVIEYQQGEVKIKYLWNTKTDSIYIEADCPDQEVVTKTIVRELPPIVLEPTFWQKIEWFMYAFLVILIILVTRKLTK